MKGATTLVFQSYTPCRHAQSLCITYNCSAWSVVAEFALSLIKINTALQVEKPFSPVYIHCGYMTLSLTSLAWHLCSYAGINDGAGVHVYINHNGMQLYTCRYIVSSQSNIQMEITRVSVSKQY